MTMNSSAVVPVPSGVVTDTGPVVAPTGTAVEIWTSESTTKLAASRLKLTPVAPVKLVPVSTTAVPSTPRVGSKDAIEGVAAWATPARSSPTVASVSTTATTTRMMVGREIEDTEDMPFPFRFVP